MVGLAIYAAVLIVIGAFAPPQWWDAASPEFLLIIGAVAIWRYGWSAVHFVRALIYKNLVFPRLRTAADTLGRAGNPGHVYILVTSFRIDTHTSVAVFRSALQEAIACGAPTTIIASIVEMADQRMVKQLFQSMNAPSRIGLEFVRIPGTGKRDGLAAAFRLIAASAPPQDAVVYVVDGDSVLSPQALARTLPFFKLHPQMDALTTDEVCEYEAQSVYRDWYNMRFAQRQLQMCSMALSRRVLTLTGRMSAFRASVVCNPDFIELVQHDAVDHWRLGRIAFLTGDDKSTWYAILRTGREMLYVPDVQITTIEYPPSPHFVTGATILMRRWFGNMLRNGGRAIALGPKPMGVFVWWSVVDQRLSMWTSLVGPLGAICLAVSYSPLVLFVYGYWVAITRLIQSLLLLNVRREVSWRYPFLLYFNQIYGSLIKTYILFRLDRQSWTRQKTVAGRASTGLDATLKDASSTAMHAAAGATLFVAVAFYVSAFDGPSLAVLHLWTTR